MKEIYFISAYTPTFEKQEMLRLLVHNINKQGKEVIVATHSSIPKDIEDMCNYVIFDRENKLIYDADAQFWSNSRVGNKGFEFINLKSAITILPCFKLNLSSFCYLKSLGYDIIHFLEYDSIINDFTYFNEVTEIIKNGEYDLIGIKHENKEEHEHLLLPLSFNLNKFSFDDFKYDENFLISEYKKRYHGKIFPITERLSYEMLWSKLKIKAESSDKIKDVMKINQNFTFGFTDKYCLHTVDGVLHILHDNLSKLDGNIIDVVVIDRAKNGKTKTFIAPYYKCFWVNLDVNYADAIYIKIFVNGSLFRELNLMNPNDRFYIDSTKVIDL
jgi:hypothetical protein